MPSSPDETKRQLNLYIPTPVHDLYREQARQAGLSKEPGKFLSTLLKLEAGFLAAVYHRLARKHQEDPAFFQTRDQRHFARELILLLGQVLEVPEA